MLKKIILSVALLSVCGCAYHSSEQEPLVVPAYDDNYERFAANVRVKQSDKFGITYEYKDVRIDEIAYMASRYCYAQGEKKAVLHDSQLFRNFSRRATFDCVELQN